MQENYASKKQKYASASHATDASGHCVRNRNERKRQPIGMLDRSSQSRLPTQALALLAVFVYATHTSHATHATQALAFAA